MSPMLLALLLQSPFQTQAEVSGHGYPAPPTQTGSSERGSSGRTSPAGGVSAVQSASRVRPFIRPSVPLTSPSANPPATLSVAQRTDWVRRFLHRDLTLEAATLRFSLTSRPPGTSFSATDVAALRVGSDNFSGFSIRQNGAVTMTVPRGGRYVFDCHVLSTLVSGEWAYSANGQAGTTVENEHHVLFVVDLTSGANEVLLRWLGSPGTDATFYECNANRVT